MPSDGVQLTRADPPILAVCSESRFRIFSDVINGLVERMHRVGGEAEVETLVPTQGEIILCDLIDVPMNRLSLATVASRVRAGSTYWLIAIAGPSDGAHPCQIAANARCEVLDELPAAVAIALRARLPPTWVIHLSRTNTYIDLMRGLFVSGQAIETLAGHAGTESIPLLILRALVRGGGGLGASAISSRIWPDKPHRPSRLSNHIMRLRRLFGEDIIVHSSDGRLDLSDYETVADSGGSEMRAARTVINRSQATSREEEAAVNWWRRLSVERRLLVAVVSLQSGLHIEQVDYVYSNAWHRIRATPPPALLLGTNHWADSFIRVTQRELCILDESTRSAIAKDIAESFPEAAAALVVGLRRLVERDAPLDFDLTCAVAGAGRAGLLSTPEGMALWGAAVRAIPCESEEVVAGEAAFYRALLLDALHPACAGDLAVPAAIDMLGSLVEVRCDAGVILDLWMTIITRSPPGARGDGDPDISRAIVDFHIVESDVVAAIVPVARVEGAIVGLGLPVLVTLREALDGKLLCHVPRGAPVLANADRVPSATDRAIIDGDYVTQHALVVESGQARLRSLGGTVTPAIIPVGILQAHVSPRRGLVLVLTAAPRTPGLPDTS